MTWWETVISWLAASPNRTSCSKLPSMPARLTQGTKGRRDWPTRFGRQFGTKLRRQSLFMQGRAAWVRPFSFLNLDPRGAVRVPAAPAEAGAAWTLTGGHYYQDCRAAPGNYRFAKIATLA